VSGDIYAEIASAEAMLKQASSTLATLRMRSNPKSTCGNPSHADLAEKIASLQRLLPKLTRGSRTTERLSEGREERLRTEIERLKTEIERLEPRAARGDHELLARVKAAQQRRRILELKSVPPAPTTALVRASSPLSLAGLEKSPGRAYDMGWIMLLVAALTTVFGVGISTAGAIPLLVALVGGLGLSDYAFPGAQRELITPHMIFGERWKRIRSIELTADEMRVQGKRLYRFGVNEPGYLDAVRITLAAAVAHGIPVVGEPPATLSQLALPIASS
jgi:hypothetical protein